MYFLIIFPKKIPWLEISHVWSLPKFEYLDFCQSFSVSFQLHGDEK